MKQIRLNAFDMSCVGHIQQGMWCHPRDRSCDYNNLNYWTSLAETLERGLFDGIFLADVLGIYDVFQNSPDASIRNAVQVPLGDPTLVIPAMAYATRHLGFGVTANLSYEAPYVFARRMSTLDHLTKGRVGWNIVTGYLDSAARAMGLPQQVAHDDRYDVAEAYMDAVYQLWEGSWADDAVRRDKTSGVFADPSRVRAVHHRSAHFAVDGIHLCEPSPQRTPVLYQAGSSGRGRQFAATHAECVFVNGTSKVLVAEIVADIRAKAVEAGRNAGDIKVFVGATVITGESDAAAKAKFEDYQRYASVEGALAHASGSLGIDFSTYAPDDPITMVKTQAIVSNLEALTRQGNATHGDTKPPGMTKQKFVDGLILGGRQKPIVGGPSTVADELISWTAEADVDGFILARTVTPECFEDFVDHVVPELQSRGAYKTIYTEGTLREKLFNQGSPLLPSRHQASARRW